MLSENWRQIFNSIWEREGGKSFIQSLLDAGHYSMDAGLDINSWKNSGRTALSYAAEWGDLEIVEFLVQKGADGDVKDSDESKPLHVAAQHGHVKIVEFFLNQGVSVDSCGNSNFTPLHFAAKEGHIEVVELLIRYNADTNVKSRSCRTPLLTAAKYFKRNVVEFLIHAGAGIECCDEEHWTMLHYASYHGYIEMVQYLVNCGCNLNVKTYLGETPLLIAARKLHINVVELLIKSGADVKCCDKGRNTLLHRASVNGWLEIVQFLVDCECDLNAPAHMGCTPMLLAAGKSTNENVVKLLISAGADTEVFSDFGMTVLHLASTEGWLEVVRSLIEVGSDINSLSYCGCSPLHCACECEKVEVIKYLLKSGADWRIKNQHNQTALNCIVKEKPSVEAIRLFVRYGAYFEHSEYLEVCSNSLLKDPILKDINLCTQAIINKFNNKDLPSFYSLPGCSERLPPIEKLKIAHSQSVNCEVERSVQCAIRTNGHCNLFQARPMVLQMMCVKSLIAHYQSKREKSLIVEHQLSNKKRRLN